MKIRFLWCELILVVLLVFTQKSFAQYLEVRTGIGYASGYFISRDLEDEGFIFHGESKFSIPRNELVKYAELSLPVDKRMAIQITVGYSRFTFLNTYPYGKKIKNEYKQINLATGLRYYYSGDTTKRCKLYSSLNFGLSFKKHRTSEYTSNDKMDLQYADNNYNNAIQLNLIGITMGKRVGMYAELGYGFKGLINAGFFFRP